MSRQLSPQTSLDSLKKEAKRWLKALRANDPEARARLLRAHPNAPPEPVLRDVQHALALEHGAVGWTALTQLLTPAPLNLYEEKAVALLEAYKTGTPAAMERHWKHTWHRRTWEGMRTYVQLDLGRRSGAANQDGDISLDDARYLVAREHGFDSWQALKEYAMSSPSKEGASAAKPVTLLTAGENGSLQSAGREREWETVLGMMRDSAIPGLNAEGQMTDAVLERLSRLDHITHLNLNGSKQLTDVGVRFLANMPRLERLELSGTGVTDQGLEAMRNLGKLREISLASTAVTDAGAVHLSKCEDLERVDLSGTHTGDGAIKALAGKQRLRHFRSGGTVTDAGLKGLHAFPVIKSWHGGDTRMELLEFDAEPNYLLLRGSFTDRGLADLAGLDGLFALNLDDRNLAVTGVGLAPLASLPNLGWLAFDATDEAMPFIAALPKLRFLMCQDTVAGDEGFVSLSRSQSIEKIWGRRCYNLRSRGFRALAAMPALRSLSVSCKNVGDDALSTLPSFPALRELMPMDVPDEGYRHIGCCEGLEALILMYCRETSDRATELIADLPGLKRYFASYTGITDRTPELLSGMPSLEKVEFSGCAGLTNAGISALARLPRLRCVRAEGMPGVTREVMGAFPANVRVEIGR